MPIKRKKIISNSNDKFFTSFTFKKLASSLCNYPAPCVFELSRDQPPNQKYVWARMLGITRVAIRIVHFQFVSVNDSRNHKIHE